jgi:PASTA domain
MHAMSPNLGRSACRKLMLAAATGVASIAFLAAPSAGLADTTIGTVGAYEAEPEEFYDFGDPNTATYGQVVTAPADEQSLSSFTFYLNVPNALVFRAYVYAWDGEKATGPALYEGPDMQTTEPEGVYQPITADLGKVAVTPGRQYVLFFSISKDATDEESDLSGGWGEAPSGSYDEGELVYINNGYEPSAWTTQSWDVESGQEFAFGATFTDPISVSPVTPTAPVTTTSTTTTTTISTPAPAAAPVNCVVPKMRGLQKAAVEQALSAAHCKLGTIEYHYNKIAKGGLVEQDLHQGTIVPAGTTVSVWLSRGAAPKHHTRKHHG